MKQLLSFLEFCFASFLLFFFNLNIYLKERERERTREQEPEPEGQRQQDSPITGRENPRQTLC